MPVYLIHLDDPMGHAKHYLGFSRDMDCLKKRIEHHRKGTGSRFMQVVGERGIGWRVARIWEKGTRLWERHLKKCHSSTRYCPICEGQVALNRKADVIPDDELLTRFPEHFEEFLAGMAAA